MDYKVALKNSIVKEEVFGIVKFLVFKDYSAGLIHQELNRLLAGDGPSEATIKRWCATLKKGENINVNTRGGSQADADQKARRIQAIKNCFGESKHWSLRALASYTGMPYSAVQRIVKEELRMRKIMAKWVPHQLTEMQRDFRFACCRINRRMLSQTPNLLKRTLTIDESWVSLYMEPDRNQARQWVAEGEEPDPVISANIHGIKRMLIVAMDFNGIAFYKLLPPKTTVTGEVYKAFLEEHLENWLDGKSSQHVWLLHDNARPHKAVVVKEYLQQKGITLWEHPPYSPDISPLDFNCFAQLKRALRGIRHTDWDEFSENLDRAVNDLNGSGRMNGVQKLQERWLRVIEAEGAYIN